MQRLLAKRFITLSLGSIGLSLLCVAYMYASPGRLQISPLQDPDIAGVPVASQPTRMAFVAFSADSRIKAFWKEPEDSTIHMTIEIDPLGESADDETDSQVDGDENSAADDVETDQSQDDGSQTNGSV